MAVASGNGSDIPRLGHRPRRRGKSTLAPQLAAALDAIWLSRDTIHAKVYSGWEPAHPALSSSQYDPQIGDSTFHEGKVVWDVFLWMLTTVTPHQPVVADPVQPCLQPRHVRGRFGCLGLPRGGDRPPGDPATLLERARRRAAQPGVHEIKARFSVRPERYEQPYQPVLDSAHVIAVDTTDLDTIDVTQIAASVKSLLTPQPGKPPVK